MSPRPRPLGTLAVDHLDSPRVKLSRSGVLLQTEAPPAAVLLKREPEVYFDEGEVVVDPYLLGRVKLIETIDGDQLLAAYKC